ncbi:DUF4177 domain-containing protein [Halococcus saccharolyticus]|uniref:DUF4177 domain-containing protein n=1 Tax=Halococcus saccharolyticus TaxID=62319 RepID=UPI0009B5C91F|nr:DUF4177 domain-containing protein [Halococcus saccharolyticus]
MTKQYEYKVISAAKTFFWSLDKEKTAQRLNQAAQNGWELDETAFDWSGGPSKLILKRER